MVNRCVWVCLVVAGCAGQPRVRSGGDPVDPLPDAGTGDFDSGAVTPPVDDDGGSGACTDVVDVVFVLDVSSSMTFVLDALESDIGRVVDAANGLAPDAHFGLIAFADNYALDATGPLEAGRVHVAAATLQSAFANYRAVYTSHNRNPGDGPGGPTDQNPICEENALDSLYGAATEFPWRENATRIIIVATDDTFLERPDNYGDRDGDGDWNSTNFPREGNYPASSTVREVIEAAQAAKARVFSFTRLRRPTDLAGLMTMCGTGRRFTASQVNIGWSAAYNGEAPIPDQTDAINYDLDEVRTGSRSLADTINEVVLNSYCDVPIY